MPKTPVQSDQLRSRRVDLDWVRVIAFALLILYHMGMYYVTWDWHIKSPRASAVIEPLMRMSNPWRLSLLFFVSGVATRFMLDKWSPGELATARSWRLLIPLFFGAFFIVPWQSYYEVVEKLGYSDGIGAFYARYVLGSLSFCPNGKCIVMPTWNHLWFVPYLWVYTLLAATLWARRSRWAARLDRPAVGSPIRLIVGPCLALAVFRVLLAPIFPPNHTLVWDFYNHAQYLLVFALGFSWAKTGEIWHELSTLRWSALMIAVIGYVVMQSLAWSYGALSAMPLELRFAARVAYGVNQWCAIVAIVGFARLYLTYDGPARQYLTDAIFPYYIVHQTVIIAVAHNLQPFALPLGWEVLILFAATIAACVATYEIVRRVSWLRPLFGLKPFEHPAAGSRLT